jgi:TRAP-type transport system periplasmic protein
MTARLAIATAAGLALVAAGASADTIRWDFANDYQASSLMGETDQEFGALLAEKSGGRIEITFHFGGALGFTSGQMLDAIGTGAVIIGDASSAFYGGQHPVFAMTSLPFFSAKAEDLERLFAITRSDFEEVLEDFNHKFLFVTPWTPSGIWSKRPVTTLDELKGLKIRTYDGAGSIVFRDLAAAPVQLAWGDVVPQLTTGGIEAVLTSDEGGVNASFWEHTAHFSEINYAAPFNIASMNLDVFEALEPDLQAAVLEAAAIAQASAWERARGRVESNYGIMRSHGVTIVTDLPDDMLDAMQKAADPVVAEWVEKMGARGPAIVEAYRR